MKLKFFGAAGEVTGSCHRVETESVRFLVDCGMFQGRDSEEKNQHALALDVNELDFVLLTHAHIDHSGLLPRLVALGFNGPIYTRRKSSGNSNVRSVATSAPTRMQRRCIRLPRREPVSTACNPLSMTVRSDRTPR
jgi:glyoxylase-like metal-dependent hydrolase (beta-lactamase superfamily II)